MKEQDIILENAIDAYYENVKYRSDLSVADHFKAGAKWQLEQQNLAPDTFLEDSEEAAEDHSKPMEG